MYYDQLRRRIRLLQERKTGKVNVTLHYSDGTKETMGTLEAVEKIVHDHNIVDIKCHDETGQSLFSAMLQAEQEYGEYFDDLDDLKDYV